MASMGCLAVLLTACSNVTGLMNAKSDFGCPVVDGVNCSTLSQTFEREAAKDNPSQTVKAVYEGRSLHSDVVTLEIKEQIQSDGTIVESSHDQTVRAMRPRKFNTTAQALKPTRFQTTTGSLDRARNHERVVMLWVLPWVDDQGDLHEASRIWMRIEDAGWKIESVRTRAFEAGLSGVVP